LIASRPIPSRGPAESKDGRFVYLTPDGDASVIADRIASNLLMDISEKQALLETKDPAQRLRRILAFLNAGESRTSGAPH
jgi:hypothetical protein